mgnify:FL=1
MPLGSNKAGLLGAAAAAGGGDRGLYCGGYRYTGASYNKAIDYITISSTGNAADFGDQTDLDGGWNGCVNGTDGDRAVWNNSNDPINHEYTYVTVSTLGDAADFGNMNQLRGGAGAASNGSNDRGVWAGGRAPNNDPQDADFIEYITISSTGDGTDFGDLLNGRSNTRHGVASNGTDERMIIAGGESGSAGSGHQCSDDIEYLTISSTGNAIDFGNVSVFLTGGGCCSNDTSDRMVYGGGNLYSSPGNSITDHSNNTMYYLTITSLGDTSDFGDLSVGRVEDTSMSNGVDDRGIWAGGTIKNGAWADSDVIDYVTISSTGNATDFGDCVLSGVRTGGTSNSQA